MSLHPVEWPIKSILPSIKSIKFLISVISDSIGNVWKFGNDLSCGIIRLYPSFSQYFNKFLLYEKSKIFPPSPFIKTKFLSQEILLLMKKEPL